MGCGSTPAFPLLLALLPVLSTLPVQAQTTCYVSTTGISTDPAMDHNSTTNLQGAINASSTNRGVEWVVTTAENEPTRYPCEFS